MNSMNSMNKKSTPSGAPISTTDYGTTPEEKSEAEKLFDRIGTGSSRAVHRPKDTRIDRQLRRLIADANHSGNDCIISGSTGYYRPKDEDSVEAEVYFAAERHRARAILRKVSRMEKVFNRRYQVNE